MRHTRLGSLGIFSSLAIVVVMSVTPRNLSAQPTSLTGIMRHSSLEGGCWYLQGYDGKSYELQGDSASLTSLHREGAMVDVSVEPVRNGASTCMIGEIMRIVQVNNVRMQPYDPPVNPVTLSGTVHRTKKGTWYVVTTRGERYEFEQPPAKKYRHVGAHFRASVMLMLDRRNTKEGMNGLILSGKNSAPHKKNAK